MVGNIKIDDKSYITDKLNKVRISKELKELKDDSNIVVKFVNKIISDGIDMKASDIHIEPRLEGYAVRYRKDGMLQKVLEIPPKVEYTLTDIGYSLRPVLDSLKGWGKDYKRYTKLLERMRG